MSDNSNDTPKPAEAMATDSAPPSVPVTPAQKLDMEVYAAILGRSPVIDPTLAVKQAADAPKPVGELARSWSPLHFCLEVRRACVDNLMRHAQRQQVSDFFRRLGQNATRQIAGSQPKYVRSRVTESARQDRAA